MGTFKLGNNPLLHKNKQEDTQSSAQANQTGEPALTEEEIAYIKAAAKNTKAPTKKVGRPKNADAEDWTRATFIIRKDLLDQLKDYAYTERVDLKTAINIAIEDLIERYKGDLLNHPKKPKQIRTKRGANND